MPKTKKQKNMAINAINKMRKEHLENKDDNSSDEEDIRNTEIVIEKAGKQFKRNFPFAIDWSQQNPRRNTGNNKMH